MNSVRWIHSVMLTTVVLAAASAVPAQQQADSAAQAAYNAHQDEFDFLLGDWEFVQTRLTPAGPTKFRGLWSATRSADGAIITDEFRIVDDQGRTTYVSTTLRSYSAPQKRWNIVGVEPGLGVLQVGTAWKEGNDMRVDQVFSGGGPDSSQWRIRYSDIRPDGFSWRGDRSTDGGRTWTENYRTIEARRIGAAKPAGSLTEPKRSR
jgi:hypothetical protein